MDAEINAALAVLVLGFGKRREAARQERAYVAIAAPSHSVELVRHEGKCDVVSSVKPAQNLEDGSAETGVAGRIGREWRGKVRSREVAGRGAEWRPGWVPDSRWIAIAGASRPGARVRLPDAGDRTPHSVVIFRLPDGDSGVGHGHVHQGQQPRQLDAIGSHLVGEVHRDLIIQSRWRAQARRTVVRPEDARVRLVGGALGGRDDPISAQAFRFVVSRRIFRARHGGKRRNAELIARLQNEWRTVAPVRADRDRELADGILTPLPRQVARQITGAHKSLGDFGAVVGFEGEDRGGRPLAQLNAICSCFCMGDFAQVFGQPPVETCCLR